MTILPAKERENEFRTIGFFTQEEKKENGKEQPRIHTCIEERLTGRAPTKKIQVRDEKKLNERVNTA